jgi:hypothetical protein
MYFEAIEGFQLLIIMPNFICTLPVFFTYTVQVFTMPGLIAPQPMDETAFVQALFEYTLTARVIPRAPALAFKLKTVIMMAVATMAILGVATILFTKKQ